ncbi:TetR family transcriptional regulator [Actinomadura sp. LD22]|uniref:TetR family transcriptional regulator n=1 Tax=Actinomadura physcomitrii TaxID=2650748 RepID=A0A6I4MG68_9ACTN|nr:helix-turn-helix domain-containing protein [Actinomadura physcomitrii]MWA01579.1 TetR family transcriptional regulator [Actinomadura physcomitrii]
MAATKPGGQTLRERKKERARQEIYDAALALLAERPYEQVSVDDICERAQVGRASFFRFYGTKAGLLTEFNRRLTDLARTAIDQHPSSTQSEEEDGRKDERPGAIEQLGILQRTLAAYWASAGPGPRALALAFITEGSITMLTDSPGAIHEDLFRLVADIIEHGQTTGELSTRLTPAFAAWLLVTTLAAATCTWLTGQTTTDLHHLTGAALETLLTGLSLAPSRPSS